MMAEGTYVLDELSWDEHVEKGIHVVEERSGYDHADGGKELSYAKYIDGGTQLAGALNDVERSDEGKGIDE